jgi:hypothetical protein
MIVYKALNVYTSWCERGPAGAIYSASKSGWFDSFQFEKWFFEMLLPHLRRKPGKKMIVGDNLASHISSAVIQACKDHDIQFVCLPPNSTDKLQPLDVGVFGPVKKAWRVILTEYKTSHPTQVGIPKTEFPRLMAKLLERSNPGQYLPAAFDRCGLYPVSLDRAVESIPHRSMECSESTRELLNSTLGEKLDQLRGTDKSTQQKKRGKKVKVPAGKSYTDVMEEDEEEEIREREREREEEREEEEDDPQEGTSRGKKTKVNRKTRAVSSSESEEELPEIENYKDHEDSEEEETDEDTDEEDNDDDHISQKKPPAFPVGSFVVAVYDRNWYLAQVEGEEPENECEGFTLLKYMDRKGHNKFVWGEVNDLLKTINTDILLAVDPPLPNSSRFWGLPKDDLKKVENLFMVKWSIIIYVSFQNFEFKIRIF